MLGLELGCRTTSLRTVPHPLPLTLSPAFMPHRALQMNGAKAKAETVGNVMRFQRTAFATFPRRNISARGPPLHSPIAFTVTKIPPTTMKTTAHYGRFVAG